MLVCLLAAWSLLTGCQSAAVTAPQPGLAAMTFAPEQYPAVHAAAVEVLREHGFRISRNDYRFGKVTTYPKESPTLAEFWIDDATTWDQRRSDTLNAQQRSAKIQIDRASDPTVYELRVEVLVERLQRPERYLTHSATGQLSASYAGSPQHLRDRGIDGPYAQVLTRDPLLEARLLEAIKAAIQ